jgi:hypothetical protein
MLNDHPEEVALLVDRFHQPFALGHVVPDLYCAGDAVSAL